MQDLDIPQEDIAALARLIEHARGHSGQAAHIRRFLLALYNPGDWPLDLSRLRALDAPIRDDALAVLRMDSTPPVIEIHQLVEDGEALFRDFWRRESSSEVD
jgi:hypothetical protein